MASLHRLEADGLLVGAPDSGPGTQYWYLLPSAGGEAEQAAEM
ncbi:hypothetical protein ACFUCQ_03205 [Streptomyces sp. NPDC057197]